MTRLIDRGQLTTVLSQLMLLSIGSSIQPPPRSDTLLLPSFFPTFRPSNAMVDDVKTGQFRNRDLRNSVLGW
jgi:hypothetical protein